MTDLRALPDATLTYLAGRLEVKLAALRSATSAIGVAMFEQYRERLDQVRAELERRHV